MKISPAFVTGKKPVAKKKSEKPHRSHGLVHHPPSPCRRASVDPRFPPRLQSCMCFLFVFFSSLSIRFVRARCRARCRLFVLCGSNFQPSPAIFFVPRTWAATPPRPPRRSRPLLCPPVKPLPTHPAAGRQGQRQGQGPRWWWTRASLWVSVGSLATCELLRAVSFFVFFPPVASRPVKGLQQPRLPSDDIVL